MKISHLIFIIILGFQACQPSEPKTEEPLKEENNTPAGYVQQDGFLLKLPETWKMEYSVFNNQKNEKIGELMPGLITNKPEYDQWLKGLKEGFPDSHVATKYIKTDSINVNGTVWKDIIWKFEVHDHSGAEEHVEGDEKWMYDHNIFKPIGEGGLFFAFYSESLVLENRTEIETILASIEINGIPAP